MIQLQFKTLYTPSDFLNRLSNATETKIQDTEFAKQLVLHTLWKGAIKTLEIAHGSFVEIMSTKALQDIETTIAFDFEEEWFLLSLYLRDETVMVVLEAINSIIKGQPILKKYGQEIIDTVIYTSVEPQNFQNHKITYYLNRKWILENISKKNHWDDFFLEQISKIASTTTCSTESNIYVNVHTLIPTVFRLETTDTEINQLNELAIFVINYLRGYEMDDTAYNKDINSIILLGNYLRFYDFQKSLPSLEALTKFTGLNRNKLQKLFREQFGKTYYQFYQEARFRFAEELITKRGYNISETARMVGFKHISHFSTYFEKIMGYRPIVLKKKTF